LGWINFVDHRILRVSTKKRMLKRIALSPSDESVSSYFGLIKHGNTNKLKERVLEIILNG